MGRTRVIQTPSMRRSVVPRRLWFCGRAVAVVAVSLAFVCRGVAAAPEGDKEHLERIHEHGPVDEAIDRGLAYLATQQDPVDGHFNGSLENVYTALACMAFMASGHFPERSRYGDNLRRGILFLTQQSPKHDGYFGADGGRMYGHGICTLALLEAFGMMPEEEDNRRIKEAVDPALQVILKAQQQRPGKHFGGWRYEPQSSDSDLSVAAWQMLALRAAQNCQFAVPQQAIDDALTYVRATYWKGLPGFTYQGGGGSRPAMRAAGVVCMLALGSDQDEKDREMIDNSARVLMEINPDNGSHYYYQSYYFATAANMMEGEYRETLMPKLEKALLGLQEDSGAFRKHSGHDGEVYATAFAVICLAVNYQYLPIYQD